MHAKYVKAYVKRGKSDSARRGGDLRGSDNGRTMRFVADQSVEQQIDRSAGTRPRSAGEAAHAADECHTQPCWPSLALSPAAGCAASTTLADKITAGDAVIPRARRWPHCSRWSSIWSRLARELSSTLEARLVGEPGSDRYGDAPADARSPASASLTAHAVVTAIGDVRQFSTGRDFAAWCGADTADDTPAPSKHRIGHISRHCDHQPATAVGPGRQQSGAPCPQAVVNAPMPGSTASSPR